jgi:hypothetical protein
MFDQEQFAKLYALLDGEMVAGDCGLPCQQYCCRAADAVKYLLPGEAEFFRCAAPANFEMVDYFLYCGYRARDREQCACTRALRPFCCRIFPFRPRIDLSQCEVIDLSKAVGAGFDAHCWVTEPLPQWRDGALQAWRMVLADIDNLNFYARYALFLLQARNRPDASASSVLFDVVENLSTFSLPQRWRAAALLFELLGRDVDQWPASDRLDLNRP